MDSYLVHIGAVDGTEVCNVDRMMSYAATQLGLVLTGAVCEEDWSAYQAVLSGQHQTVRHLLTLVESAYPGAEIRIRPV